MISPITSASIRAPQVVKSVQLGPEFPVAGAGESAKSGSANLFRALLADSISQVQNRSQLAEQTVQQFLTGETQDLHQVAIATQKAELGFEFFLQTRNKVVQAYQEIMRMQL